MTEISIIRKIHEYFDDIGDTEIRQNNYVMKKYNLSNKGNFTITKHKLKFKNQISGESYEIKFKDT